MEKCSVAVKISYREKVFLKAPASFMLENFTANIMIKLQREKLFSLDSAVKNLEEVRRV